MQKNTGSTIISVVLLALLIWALSSGKKDVNPRKGSEETQVAAKETPAPGELEKTPIEKPPEEEKPEATNKPSGKKLPEEPIPEVNPPPIVPPVAKQAPEEKAEPPENTPPPAPAPKHGRTHSSIALEPHQ